MPQKKSTNSAKIKRLFLYIKLLSKYLLNLKPLLFCITMCGFIASTSQHLNALQDDVSSVAPKTEIIVDASFDSGSIGAFTVIANEVTLKLKIDNIGYKYWTNFRLSGVLGLPVKINITGVGDVPFLTEQLKINRMVYSCNGEGWDRLTNHSYSSSDSGTYTFVETFSCDNPQIATFFPFSYQKMQNLIRHTATSYWATHSSLGKSPQNRKIDLLSITSRKSTNTNKKIIYIIGRQHAAESASSYMLEGLFNLLTSETPVAERLRNNYVWYFVPMVNPDGVFLGNSRETAAGNDPNRDWGNKDSVEINLVRSHLNSIASSSGVDMFIDWHSQMNDNRWHNFIYAPTGNTFFTVLSTWTDFDSLSTESNLCSTNSCSARGYATQQLNLSSYVLEPSPHLAAWTSELLQQQGMKTAFAIEAHFNQLHKKPLSNTVAP